jgi:hypothetical protein
MSLVAIESSYLDGIRADGRPAGALSADAFVAARLVDKDELVGSELRDFVKVITLKICILLPCYPSSRLLRLFDRIQRSAYACLRHLNAKFVVYKPGHLILIQPSVSEKLFAKSI